MPSSKLFWISAALTAVFTGMYFLGYSAIEIVLLFIIADIVMLKLQHDKLGHSVGAQVMGEVTAKFGGAIADMTNFMRNAPTSIGAASDVTLGGIEAAFSKHKEDIRTEFNDGLDRMAKKAIDIENKLNTAVKNFSSAIGAFDDRLRSLESTDGTMVAEPVPVQTNGGAETAEEPETTEEKTDENYMELSF